jgi:16S rRNA (cytidine1402-2'-O)-methyltransferase
MGSGLNGQSFAFNGYLPTDASLRAKRIKELEDRSRRDKQTQILIETPYRNAAMLDALATHCNPQSLVCVATDLSLPDEAIITQTATEWRNSLRTNGGPDFHKKPTVFLFLAQ